MESTLSRYDSKYWYDETQRSMERSYQWVVVRCCQEQVPRVEDGQTYTGVWVRLGNLRCQPRRQGASFGKNSKVMLILERFHSQISGSQSGSLENWPLYRGDIVDPFDWCQSSEIE